MCGTCLAGSLNKMVFSSPFCSLCPDKFELTWSKITRKFALASDEEESWNCELNTSLAENGEIGCGAFMRWVCVLIIGRR